MHWQRCNELQKEKKDKFSEKSDSWTLAIMIIL